MEKSHSSSLLILDEFKLVRNRVSHLFQGLNITVYEASNEIELFNLLTNKDCPVDLIIMDLGHNADHGFRLIAKIKEKKPKTPIVILTAHNKRSIFIRGVAEGASDYILKPFEDDYLSQKVLFLLEKKNLEKQDQASSNQKTADPNIVFDIQSYLYTEFKKAQKGNYEITVFMITFFIPTDELDAQIEKQYIQVSDLLYANLKRPLFHTDVLIRYGSQSFICISPYCGSDNAAKVQQKLTDSFEELKKEAKELASFYLALSAMTCSSEPADAKELLLSLGSQMKQTIDTIKKDLM